MKIVVIYDSQTGNTEKLAQAIAEGAKEVCEVEVKKIGEPFPLTLLAEVDGVAFGSPVYYADISSNMKEFLEHIETYSKANRKKVTGIPAAIFGTYGYDGAWLMEEKLKKMVAGLGFKVFEEVLVTVDTEVRYNLEAVKKKASEFSRRFASSI